MNHNEFAVEINKHTLVDILENRAKYQGNEICYGFYDAKGELVESITCSDFYKKALKLAYYLHDHQLSKKKALLVYTPGLEFIVAYFACMLANIIAIPCYPPFANNLALQFQAIYDDAEPDCILVNKPVMAIFSKLKFAEKFNKLPLINYFINRFTYNFDFENLPNLKKSKLIITDAIHYQVKDNHLPRPNLSDIAFLQYTSGSTGKPKGVMVTHQNLIHNILQIKQFFAVTRNSRGAIWLPPYHDMGLIGGILSPMLGQFPVFFLSPGTVLQKPYLWLKIISDQQATISGGPNFMYEVCIKRVTEEQKKNLDLSSWQIAFNGADYIHEATLKNFYQAFKHCGFQYDAFYPCYGLAEATLIVTGKSIESEQHTSPIVQEFDWDKYKKENLLIPATSAGKKLKLVGCGLTALGQEIIIANPETQEMCKENQIGEIWVKGLSVTKGYYKNEKATTETYVFCKNVNDGPYLRTGDLGCIINNNLYVTGRYKDIIVHNGNNYYPYEIESDFQNQHTALRRGCGVIMQIVENEQEKLIVIQETTKANNKKDYEELADLIHNIVLKDFTLHIDTIIFIRPKILPRTTSGKLRRHFYKELYANKKIKADFEKNYNREN